jgi:hypothetical protein
VTGALPALINFFILLFVHESPSWVKEKESARTSHWAPVDLFGVVIASIAALAIIYIWSPLAPVGTITALLLTGVGLGIALWGYLLPVKKYLGRSVAAGDVLVADRVMIVRNLLVGAGLAGVALLGTWGTVQQAAKWASGLVPETNSTPIIEYTVITTALGAVLASFISPPLADRLGRRLTYILLCGLSLASALAFFQGNTGSVDGTVGLWFYASAFLMGGLTAAFYGFFPLYLPELFPTSVRATGQGFCYNFGRLVAAIGSLQLATLVGWFTSDRTSLLHASANAYSVLSCVYLVGMVLIWFSPETKGRALT